MTTNWNINQLNAYPEKDGKQDVVFTVHWDCTGVDGDYSGRVYGSCGVTLDPSAPYTPYADLTKDQVLGWVWASVNKDETEASVQAQIDEKKTPTVVTPPLPF
jgi:hypothetical protein